MVQIIIALLVIGIIITIFEKLSELVGGWKILTVLIVVYIVALLALSWIGVLVVTVALVIVALLKKSGIFIRDTIVEHDQEQKEAAKIVLDTQISKEMHDNDQALQMELNRSCRQLGCMDAERWRRKLPNYVNKKYSQSFEKITWKFAKQIEEQYVLQNDDWFQPFLNYLISHPQGATVGKMLHEARCPQFYYTRVTREEEILEKRLWQGTQRVQKDVPAVFTCTNVGEMGNLYALSAYGKKLYGVNQSFERENHTEEINFNDL